MLLDVTRMTGVPAYVFILLSACDHVVPKERLLALAIPQVRICVIGFVI